MKNSHIGRVIVLHESNSVGTFSKDGIHLSPLYVSFAVFIRKKKYYSFHFFFYSNRKYTSGKKVNK